jgi:AAA ATPase domain
MFVGRALERRKLREAILARHSLLVCGPPGSGKTALLEKTLATLPAAVREKCLVCSADGSPRQIWRSLAGRLAEIGDTEVTSRKEREAGVAAPFDRWLQRQTSLRLRGILRRAMRSKSYWVVLEATTQLPAGVYRMLQEWMWSGRTPVILLARGFSENDLGRASRLFWHPGLRLELSPLQPSDLKTLLEDCLERFHLQKFTDEVFCDFLLEQCAGLPGRIVQLCGLASRSAYQYEGRVKLHTLAVDFLMQIQGDPKATSRAHQNG